MGGSGKTKDRKMLVPIGKTHNILLVFPTPKALVPFRVPQSSFCIYAAF